MRLRELCQEGRRRLEACGIEEAELDSRLLLCGALHMDTGAYLAHMEDDALPEVTALYERYLSERERRRPLQYILGYTEFMGLRFRVDERVLIPRQDTELLCELVLSEHKDRDCSLLDLCTGSGAIAVSLALLGGYSRVMATAISEPALELARENLRLDLEERDLKAAPRTGADSVSATACIKQDISFVCGDLFGPVREAMRAQGIEAYDIIVSNPPYIREQELEELEPEVRLFEPRNALWGSEDGLIFYRRIASEAGSYMRAGGRLYLEIGFDQGREVSELLRKHGFINVSVHRDYSGHDRVVSAEAGL